MIKGYLVGIPLEEANYLADRMCVIFNDNTSYYFNQDGWHKNRPEELDIWNDYLNNPNEQVRIHKVIEDADWLKVLLEDKFLNDKTPYDILNYNCVAVLWNLTDKV